MSQEIRVCVFKILRVRRASLGTGDTVWGDFSNAERCDTEHASFLLCRKCNVMYLSVRNTESSALGSRAGLESVSEDRGGNVGGIQNAVVATRLC